MLIPIDYFINQDNTISEFNVIVKKLTNIIDDIISYAKSGMFYSIENTKNKYPPISHNFAEKTIYLAFIYFCKFKSLIPIPADLLPLCTDKPEFDLINEKLNLEQTIQKLKDSGKQFDNEAFLVVKLNSTISSVLQLLLSIPPNIYTVLFIFFHKYFSDLEVIKHLIGL